MCTSVSAQKVVSVERNHRIWITFTYLLLGSHRISALEASLGVGNSRDTSPPFIQAAIARFWFSIIFKVSDRSRSLSLTLITHLGSTLSLTLTAKIARSLVGPADK